MLQCAVIVDAERLALGANRFKPFNPVPHCEEQRNERHIDNTLVMLGRGGGGESTAHKRRNTNDEKPDLPVRFQIQYTV